MALEIPRSKIRNRNKRSRPHNSGIFGKSLILTKAFKYASFLLNLKNKQQATMSTEAQTAQAPDNSKKKSAPKKRTARKKLQRHKVSHRKVTNKGHQVKRLGKLALPRNTKDKPHVEFFFDALNSKLITPKQRAEVVEAVAKFATNTSSCKKYELLVAKLKGKIIIDPNKINGRGFKL